MKSIIVIIIFILFFNSSFSQEHISNDCTITEFEVYIDDEDSFSNIRKSPKGQIVLKLNNTNSYGYVLNVIDAKDGWLKINRISGVDEYDISNFIGWVHNSIVGAAVTHSLDVFEKPNIKSNKVGKLIGEQRHI